MTRSRLLVIFVLAAVFPAAFLSGVSAKNRFKAQDSAHEKKHGFVVKQYEDFHDVLHPLEHEALPQNDFKRIRTKSAQLASRGKAIVRLGMPRGITKDNRPEFARELKKFSAALTKFRSDARRGTDDQLKISYSAVHDSFEMLASMLPRS